MPKTAKIISNGKDAKGLSLSQNRLKISDKHKNKVEKKFKERLYGGAIGKIVADKKFQRSLAISAAVKDESIQRLTNKELRTLYVKFQPGSNIKGEEDVKGIISEAMCISVPHYCLHNPILSFCFIEFPTPEIAKNAKEKYLNTTFPSGILSMTDSTMEQRVPELVDPLRLRVTNIPKDATFEEIRALFPGSFVDRNDNSKSRKSLDFKTVAYLLYKCPKEARNAFWAGRDLKLHNNILSVLYTVGKSDAKSKFKKSKKKNYSAKTKQKNRVEKTLEDKTNGHEESAMDDVSDIE